MFPSVDELNLTKRGETIFVLGTSGSLKHHDLSRLKGFTTIGTNHILEHCPVDYLVVVDYRVIELVVPHLMEARGRTVLLTRPRLAEAALDMGFGGPTYVLSVEPKPDMYFRGPLKQVDNTSHYAVEMAMRMRGTGVPGSIVLLGVDLRYPTEEEQAAGEEDHVFGEGEGHGCKPAFAKPIAEYPKTFAWLKKRKIDLITCSPWDGPLTEVLIRRDLDKLYDELTGGQDAQDH